MMSETASCYTVDKSFPYYCGGCITGQGCLYQKVKEQKIILGESVSILFGEVSKNAESE